MAFDLARLQQAIDRHGPVVRIVVADVKGSAPRETGTAMLVWADGQSGTIGGGALEFEAVNAARRQLSDGRVRHLAQIPLGPALGQCCGGAVALLSEVFTAGDLGELQRLARAALPFCRPAQTGEAPAPLAVTRILNAARAQGVTPESGLVAGWMIEAFAPAARPLWIYGAGHVGRALVQVLAPLGYDICWVDTHANRFPADMPENVSPMIASDPARAVEFAPAAARHLILTFSHAIDLDICHRLLSRDFLSAGLIGSATKWARFQSRLAALGHSPARIAEIACPIGLPELGKAPEAIAVGVATTLLMQDAARRASPDIVKDIAI